jgi:tetratricopeptide (TPR) repeat protein
MTQSKDTAKSPEPLRDTRIAHDDVADVANAERPAPTARAPLAVSRALEAPPPPIDAREAGTESEGGRAESIRALADELARRGDLPAAIAAYQEHLTNEPDDTPARRGLAAVLEQKGDFAGALGELGRALDSHPDDIGLLCARAGVQMAMQRYDQAEADLRRATKLDADSAEVLFNFGMLFCKKARWREAIEPLRRAVELDAGHAAGHYYLAEAYNQTDQLKLALGAYEDAVKLQPSNWRALKGVGIVLDKLGRPAEATAAYQRAREAQRR